jgi:hypothetical protein
MLAQNEFLAVGTMVDWDTKVKTWFPEDDTAAFDQQKGDTGFEQLVAKLGVIGRTIANGPAPQASVMDM